MTITFTRQPSRLTRIVSAPKITYLRWRLGNVEKDIEHHERTIAAWKLDAQAKRVELSLLEKEAGL